MKFLRNFIFGTLNYRNKGIPLWLWPRVGYHYARGIQESDSAEKIRYLNLPEFRLDGNFLYLNDELLTSVQDYRLEEDAEEGFARLHLSLLVDVARNPR